MYFFLDRQPHRVECPSLCGSEVIRKVIDGGSGHYLLCILVLWRWLKTTETEPKQIPCCPWFVDSLQDYCGYERFNARCSTDHVINVRRALYGRMQPGRCITGDYGHVMGCYADVTAYVSDTCDYRQNCTLLVATMDSVAQPCAKDFKSYLQAYYVCIRGQWTEYTWTGKTGYLEKVFKRFFSV